MAGTLFPGQDFTPAVNRTRGATYIIPQFIKIVKVLSCKVRNYKGRGLKGEAYMKTEFHSMRTELETAKWPIDPAVIPNHMGINLCSVEGISWARREDGQLLSITIHFIPTVKRVKCIGTYGELSRCFEP
jgi:hypothetical protein